MSANTETAQTPVHKIVSNEEWIAARKELLEKEKHFTKLRDKLNQERRDLPWEIIAKDYTFDTAHGKKSLAELFDGRSQLVVYHFMFGPDWEEGCKSCSFWADNFNQIIPHLNQRDVTMLAISRAPLSKLEAFKKRMRWDFNWISSQENSFNFDFNVSFTPEEIQNKKGYYNYQTIDPAIPERHGISVFLKDDSGNIYHTYSTYARGADLLNTAYNYLDIVPKGRDENELSFTMAWLNFHDKY